MICWSMKMRMMTKMAGTADTRHIHQGFTPKGYTTQPRCGLVGFAENKKSYIIYHRARIQSQLYTAVRKEA